jgi:hypothetical protein
MEGEKDIAIVSDVASCGISLQVWGLNTNGHLEFSEIKFLVTRFPSSHLLLITKGKFLKRKFSLYSFYLKITCSPYKLPSITYPMSNRYD